MKVLVVSHNVFSDTSSMGKTLLSYFSEFNENNLAQFFIHSEVPTSQLCKKYYRITDSEAIKSIIGIKVGKIFSQDEIDTKRVSSRTDTDLKGTLYQKARRRTPLIYLIRNFWWLLSRWNSSHLQQWLDEFNPDCIFFASGDYAFMYDIARKIAVSRKIPLYIACMDEYYIYNKNEGSFLGKIQHRLFMKSVRKAMNYATSVFCVCEKMSIDYSMLLKKHCITIYTSSSISSSLDINKKIKISYLGNLGLQRNKQLIAIGRCLKSLGLEPDHIDVYSSESRKEIVDEFNEENGIIFHGAVSADKVLQVIGESLAVIHTESFDEKVRRRVRYSVSTKIADSLASGTCIFAYGPEEVASIDYLKNENAAICCTDERLLKESLENLILNNSLRETTIKNALQLAQKNHKPNKTPEIIKSELDK